MTDTSPTPASVSRQQRRQREATIHTISENAARWDALGYTARAARARAILQRIKERS